MDDWKDAVLAAVHRYPLSADTDTSLRAGVRHVARLSLWLIPLAIATGIYKMSDAAATRIYNHAKPWEAKAWVEARKRARL